MRSCGALYGPARPPSPLLADVIATLGIVTTCSIQSPARRTFRNREHGGLKDHRDRDQLLVTQRAFDHAVIDLDLPAIVSDRRWERPTIGRFKRMPISDNCVIRVLCGQDHPFASASFSNCRWLILPAFIADSALVCSFEAGLSSPMSFTKSSCA